MKGFFAGWSEGAHEETKANGRPNVSTSVHGQGQTPDAVPEVSGGTSVSAQGPTVLEGQRRPGQNRRHARADGSLLPRENGRSNERKRKLFAVLASWIQECARAYGLFFCLQGLNGHYLPPVTDNKQAHRAKHDGKAPSACDPALCLPTVRQTEQRQGTHGTDAKRQ